MTYLEQYITRAHILPRNAPDWLMESLKKLKDPKNERQIKKIHEFIDYVENKGEKLLLYQKANLELMVINTNSKIIKVKGNMRHNARNQSNKIIQKLRCCSDGIIDDVENILDKLIESGEDNGSN